MQIKTVNVSRSFLVAIGFAATTSLASAASLTCGGFGSDESSRMLAAQPEHSATLIFAARAGNYVSSVQTRVLDARGNEVASASCGPIGQLDVDDRGRYRVEAEYRGERLTQTLDLAPRSGGRTVFRFDTDN